MPQSIPFEDQYWENKREEYDKYFWGDDEDDSSDFFEEFEELAKADA